MSETFTEYIERISHPPKGMHYCPGCDKLFLEEELTYDETTEWGGECYECYRDREQP